MSDTLDLGLAILSGALEGPGIGKDQKFKSVVSYASFLFSCLRDGGNATCLVWVQFKADQSLTLQCKKDSHFFACWAHHYPNTETSVKRPVSFHSSQQLYWMLLIENVPLWSILNVHLPLFLWAPCNQGPPILCFISQRKGCQAWMLTSWVKLLPFGAWELEWTLAFM